MDEIIFNKTELDNILTSLNYYDNFKDNYLNRKFDKINYGKTTGELEFLSFFDAAAKYPVSTKITEVDFKRWNNVFNSKNSTDEEILCAVLEVFVWGNVLSGNVKKAVELYKNNTLGIYIRQVIELLESKEIINNSMTESKKNADIELIWSSGWTKVYSFININFLIYDSRVSAFLNHTLTYEVDYGEKQLRNLKKLTKYLFNFEGAPDRERLVDREWGFKNSNPNGKKGFNANLIATWIIELLKEKLSLQDDFRLFERAFFMLGFDLRQIKGSVEPKDLQSTLPQIEDLEQELKEIYNDE